jgi:hypothetical protein
MIAAGARASALVGTFRIARPGAVIVVQGRRVIDTMVARRDPMMFLRRQLLKARRPSNRPASLYPYGSSPSLTP